MKKLLVFVFFLSLLGSCTKNRCWECTDRTWLPLFSGQIYADDTDFYCENDSIFDGYSRFQINRYIDSLDDNVYSRGCERLRY